MAFLSFSSDEKTDEKGDSLPPSRRQPSPAGGSLPPPEEAFPYGEGGPGAARAG